MHLNACAGGDAAFARGLDDIGLAALLRGHAADDALLAADVALGAVEVGFFGALHQMGRQVFDHAGEPPHLLHLLQLAQKVVQVEVVAALDLGREFFGRFEVDVGRDLFHQRHDVAHAQNAPGMALGVEHFEAVHFFAGAGKLDGRIGNLPHRQRRAAARIAIQFGQHHAGKRQCLFERPGRVGRILALHGVDHQQGFNRMHRGVQRLDFGHQGFINGQAAGRIDQQHVEIMPARMVERRKGDVDRLLLSRAGKPFGPHLLGDGFELLDGRRPVHVARDGEDFFLALFDQVLGQFGGGGGFARPLQARHEDDGGRLRGKVEVADAIAHGRGQFLVDDADQHLPRRETGEHVLAQRLFLDARDEVAHNGQRNVGFEQRHAHFAQHVLHVAFSDTGLAADGFDQAREFFGKGGSHGVRSV